MTYSILISSRALQNFLWMFVGVAIAIALMRPRLFDKWFRGVERFASRLASRGWQATLVAGMLPLVARVVLLPVLPYPGPRVHDEFSYLLLGDTFAHGRLANPTPPSWQHFETEYELMRPTYASQYQPGQGLFLAAGEVVAGRAWWGVWLSVGLMCAALHWALAGVIPGRWALFGAIAAALQFGIYGFWMNSYYGGAVAAMGGALVFGSLTRRRYPAWCALGFAILFATRPVEGLLWAVVAVCMTVGGRVSQRGAMAFLVVAAGGAGLLGYYNYRVTGNAVYPPYVAYRNEYGVPQSYWWQPAVTVANFRNHELAANYRDQLSHWQERGSAAALWNATWRRARDFWRFFIGPFLTPALLFAGLLFLKKKLRPWLWASAVFIADHATYHAWYPQQSAPETVVIVLLTVECWRRLRVWQRRRGTGVAATRFLMAGFAVAILAVSIQGDSRVRAPLEPARDPREGVIRQLQAITGKHLVFVHYGPGHNWYNEWVFNEADLPGSQIVFARMLGPESDRALAGAMGDRDVWVVEADRGSLSRW